MQVLIMSRAALMELAKDPFPPGTAVISITNSDAADVELCHIPEQILRLKFDEVSDEIYEDFLGRKPTVREMHQLSARFHMLSDHQAQQLADFILSRNNQGILICQCEHGQSRSAGIAAAAVEYYLHRGVHIFADPRYCPNKYVFRKLLRNLRTKGGQRCP